MIYVKVDLFWLYGFSAYYFLLYFCHFTLMFIWSGIVQASSKLVSALKGSRAQNGLPSNIKLYVKWAPEVYDPPCTIMSHTVKKNHIQRPKAKKKDGNKNKRKSKPMRGTNPERRTENKSSISNMVESMDIRSFFFCITLFFSSMF